nr:acetyl-CoA acetyltransferase [Bradyrhizobium sp. CCGE-LA001]
MRLATMPLEPLNERNNLSEGAVDEAMLGVVDPTGEAGPDVARLAAQKAGLSKSMPGVQINRFCASELDAANSLPPQSLSSKHELVIDGGAETASLVGMGASSGALAMDPSGCHLISCGTAFPLI